MKRILFFMVFVVLADDLLAQPETHRVKKLRITILSTMLAQPGIGEWGFSALVEADSVRILFDAGGRKETVLENSRELKMDLANIPSLVLSHGHWDHTAGWIPLRNAALEGKGNSFSVTHVAAGIFDERIASNGNRFDNRRQDSLDYVRTGGTVVQHNGFKEIFPGIYLTGPVPRVHPEYNYSRGMKRRDANGTFVDDNVPEDMSLAIQTEKGLVLLSGCGHSGIINTVDYVQAKLGQQPLLAAIGGFHLYQNDDAQIKWTAERLKKSGIRYFMGAHCTGIEPVYQIREWAGLKRGECIVGSVGAAFDPDKGFTAGQLTK